MEQTKEGERTIFIFGIEVAATVVVEVFGVGKFKERYAVEGTEVGRELRRAESISRITVAVTRFSRISDSLLRVASNVATDD